MSTHGGVNIESPAHSAHHGSQDVESGLEPSCLLWLKHHLQLLCPSATDKLRGSADGPAAFVDDLFSSAKHVLVFEDFLNRTDGLPLFVALQPARVLSMTTSIPRPGTYVSFMYFLKPPCNENPLWRQNTLTETIQVQSQAVRMEHQPLCCG